MENIDKLKYPLGKFKKPTHIDKIILQEWISIIEDFPKKLRSEVHNLTENEFEKQYRPNGWSVRQIVNHCADSHMNSLIRFKLALTEQIPVIKPYLEDLWAELSDTKIFHVESSLKILEGLHERWVHLLNSLSDEDLERQFEHPETGELVSLKINIGIYAWHCEHHLAHVKNAKLDVEINK
ncbi:MAG: YfiT family bacillithiol transferase [Pedobacter sp.]